MKHLLLILLLIASLSGKSQSTSQIDSLKNVLAKYSSQRTTFPSDTMRVRLLCAMAGQFNNPDSSLKYAVQAKTIATERNWVDGVYESGFLVAKVIKSKGLYYQALDGFFELEMIVERKKNKKLQAIIFREIGDTYMWLHDYNHSFTYYKEAMSIFKRLKEYEEFADTENNLAIAKYYNLEYSESINLLKDCLLYLPYIKGVSSEISFYDNLSLVYAKIGRFPEALMYSKKSLKKYENLTSKHNPLKARSLIQYAIVYQRLKNYPLAIYYANLSERLNKESGANNIDVYQLYYEVYKEERQYPKALSYLELFKKAELNKFSLSQAQTINSIQSIYQLDKEKDKVLLLNTNLEKENFQKKVGFAGLIVISIFLGLAYWSYLQQKQKKQKIGEQKLAIEDLNNSLEIKVSERTYELEKANESLLRKNKEISEALFKGQSIERTRVASALHDNLGGTMAALKWMMESINTEGLSDDDLKIFQNSLKISSETYSDVRFMSHNFIPESLSQFGLQGAIKKLCQDISQTQRLIIDFEDQTFSEFSHQIELEIYSICLELTTNMFKHSKANQAKILMQEDSEHLVVVVQDNGVGIQEHSKQGKGLSNIRKRLESIKGTLEVQSIPNQWSIFSLKIPLTMLEEYKSQ